MKPFLGQVAEAFYREYNRDIQNMVFVFPNRRAGIFFKKYLSDIIDGPIFSPTVTTVSESFHTTVGIATGRPYIPPVLSLPPLLRLMSAKREFR